ncbi:PadR family transcriptional regulator [Cryobacterium cryoconiti]|uniref:PadR family transcriptional regulator n=1 Tax=Cryobacterium cryoconiti TaxID=1259239 RepID=UPI001F541D57|nr:PadR family transcriptional regulator [Cryobacterium cryoconiti]
MSVRCCLLAILTIGPAYGFQLHGELHSRTAGRRAVNVGQIYGTLERLVKQDAVESAGTTADGLPLYRVTARGEAEAIAWLCDTESTPGDEWNDLVDRVLIVSSLPLPLPPGVDVSRVIVRYREWWQGQADAAGVTAGGIRGQDALATAARAALAGAALAWLGEAARKLADSPEDSFQHGLSDVRPKRGRRPASAA